MIINSNVLVEKNHIFMLINEPCFKRMLIKLRVSWEFWNGMDFLKIPHSFLRSLHLKSQVNVWIENIIFHQNSYRVCRPTIRYFTIVTLPRLKPNTSGTTDTMEENSCLPMRVTSKILIFQKPNAKIYILFIGKVISVKTFNRYIIF